MGAALVRVVREVLSPSSRDLMFRNPEKTFRKKEGEAVAGDGGLGDLDSSRKGTEQQQGDQAGTGQVKACT